MKLIHTRSLIAALGLSLVAHGAWAQPASLSAPASTATTTAMPTAPAQGSLAASTGTGTSTSMSHRDGMQAAASKNYLAAIAKLGLSATQQTLFQAAQTARKDLRQAKHAAMLERKKMMAEQLNAEQMDPRAAIALNKQLQPAIQAKRTVAQEKWLAFWDELTAEQRKTFTAEMKVRQTNMAQHHQKGPHG